MILEEMLKGLEVRAALESWPYIPVMLKLIQLRFFEWKLELLSGD